GPGIEDDGVQVLRTASHRSEWKYGFPILPGSLGRFFRPGAGITYEDEGAGHFEGGLILFLLRGNANDFSQIMLKRLSFGDNLSLPPQRGVDAVAVKSFRKCSCDSGIHASTATRQQAISFFSENSADDPACFQLIAWQITGRSSSNGNPDCRL